MEIEFICGDVYRIWFARGHVDKLEVYQSAVEQDTFGDYGKSLPAAVHTYFHARPLRDGGVYYDEVKPPLPRGSFPATAIIQLY